MIVTRLRGGLGNQLFQYAAGRRLAWHRGTDLQLDLGVLERSENRHYALHGFEITARRASSHTVKRCCSPPLPVRLVRRLFGRAPGVVREEKAGFEPGILRLPNGTCLDGYWQSERYFADAEEVVRRDLRFREPPSGRNRELATEISACESVSLHVRRGDYVTNPVANRMHGICDLEYYHRSVEHIRGGTESPRYYVFSDDPMWVRRNLALDAPTTIVTHNGPKRPYEDLRLMSLCRHHVIANSSFSWWGAWLAEGDGTKAGEGRMVIAPQRWVQSIEWQSNDRVPDRWLRL